MAFVTDDRVLESTTTTGTGNLALGGALTAFRAFSSAMINGDTCYYALWAVDGSGVPTGDWEVGIGTYVSSGNELNRTVQKSSNAGSAVSLAAGTKYVCITAVASRILQFDGSLVCRMPTATTVAGSTIANELGLANRQFAGRNHVAIAPPSGSGEVRAVQERLSESGFSAYFPNNGTTVGLNLGVGWTTGGTVSHPTPSTTSPAILSQAKRTRWANVVTTQNQVLGLRTATAEKRYWRGNAAGLGGFDFHARFAIGLWPAATVRLFVGLNDSNTGWVASDTLTGNGCGLWHDTTDAASVLSFVTRNGTTATKAAITLGSNLAAGQTYDFWMWAPPNGSAIYYRLVDRATGTVLVDTSTSTTIPSSTAFMGQELAMSNGTANTTVTTTAFELLSHVCQSDG